MSKGYFQLPLDPSVGRDYVVTYAERDALVRRYSLKETDFFLLLNDLLRDFALGVPAPKTANKMKKLISERIESRNAASVRAR